MMAMVRWVLVLSAAALVGCGDDSESGGSNGKCLSDTDICQFVKGVTTSEQIRSKLGNAQQYLGTQSAIYICQQISGQQVVHNDLVTFDFDDTGRLDDILVIRQGSGATPPPSCAQ